MRRVRRLARLFLPAGLVTLAGLILLRSTALPDSLQRFVHIYPYVVFAVGTILGWYFNRSRVVFALLILAVADATLGRIGSEHAVLDSVDRLVFTALAVLLPLNLAAYAMLKERGLFNARGVRRFACVAAQVLAMGLIVRLEWRRPTDWLEYSFLDTRLTTWTAIPQIALGAFGLATVFLVVRCILRRDPIEAAFLAAVVWAFLALHGIRFGLASTTSLATAGLALTCGVLETTYRMAYHDELTELPGRRALIEEFLQVGSSYAVAMVDVDHFKRFNDLFGHEVGDQALRMVAAKLGRVEGGGRAFRYGGEEFVVLFARMTAAEAVPHMEAVRRSISASCFVLRGPGRPRRKPTTPKPPTGPRVAVSLTISIGIAEPDEKKRNPQQVLKAADKALYRAKSAGRNRLMV